MKYQYKSTVVLALALSGCASAPNPDTSSSANLNSYPTKLLKKEKNNLQDRLVSSEVKLAQTIKEPTQLAGSKARELVLSSVRTESLKEKSDISVLEKIKKIEDDISQKDEKKLKIPKHNPVLPEVPKNTAAPPEVLKNNAVLPEVPKSKFVLSEVPKNNSALPEVPKSNFALSEVLKNNSTLPEVPKNNSTLPEVPKSNFALSEVSNRNSVLPEVPKNNPVLAEGSKDISVKIEETLDDKKDAALQVKKIHDPLDSKLNSFILYEARIDQLLWSLSEKLQLNLIIDPRLLSESRRISMNMKNVSAREILDQVLVAFDLHAELKGSVLTVSDMEERIFDLNIMNAKSDIKGSAGGSVFGGGGKEGGNSLRGSTVVSSELGEKSDPYEFIMKAIENIMAENASTSSTGSDSSLKPRVGLDRGSGTLYVRGRPSRLKSVAELIQRIKKSREKQIQLDVQLVDVQLADAYKFGVDWTLLRENVAAVFGSYTATIPVVKSIINGNLRSATSGIVIPEQSFGAPSPKTPAGGLVYRDNNIMAVINALNLFGNTKIISNPSLMVRNGVPAYISVGTTQRFVSKFTSTTTVVSGVASVSTDVETDNIFSGLVLAVSAQIRDDDSIELFIQPSQSKTQPNSMDLVPIGTGSVTLPIMETKTVVTTLSVKNDSTVVIGGLIDRQSADSDSGVPGLSSIPLFGKLFTKKDNSTSERELIIILRARIL